MKSGRSGGMSVGVRNGSGGMNGRNGGTKSGMSETWSGWNAAYLVRVGPRSGGAPSCATRIPREQLRAPPRCSASAAMRCTSRPTARSASARP